MRTDAARNRDQILAAARALIAAQGPDVSMDAIAEAAGVAVGTLYRHHPTKALLVSAVIEDSLGRFADAAELSAQAVQGGADALTELAALFATYAEQHAQDRALKAASSVLGVPEPDDVTSYPAGSAAHRAGTAVGSLLDAARTAGTVRPDLTLDDLTMLLAAMPDGAAHRARYVQLMTAAVSTR